MRKIVELRASTVQRCIQRTEDVNALLMAFHCTCVLSAWHVHVVEWRLFRRPYTFSAQPTP